MRRSKLFITGLFVVLLADLGSKPAAGQATTEAQLRGTVNALYSRPGDKISAKLGASTVAGGTLLPKGTQLLGHVTAVSKRAGEIGLLFDQARLKDKTIVPIWVRIVALSPSPAELIPEDCWQDRAITDICDPPVAHRPRSAEEIACRRESRGEDRSAIQGVCLLLASDRNTSGTIVSTRKPRLIKGTRMTVQLGTG